jgi:hypothetical protein
MLFPRCGLQLSEEEKLKVIRDRCALPPVEKQSKEWKLAFRQYQLRALRKLRNKEEVLCNQRKIEERAAERETACTAFLALVQTALLPLVRWEAGIVQIVMKHYKWAVLVDKVCDLEQHIAYYKFPDRGLSCRQYYVLRHHVATCQKFKHPDTDRSVRKIEGGKMAHRLKKLLSSIDASFYTWVRVYL